MQVEEQVPPKAEMEALIDKKVRAITRLAYDHNKHIHGLFESAGLNPHSDISGRADLLKAYKRGVRTTGPDVPRLYADYAPQQALLEVWSSGTSGVPKKVLMSSHALLRFKRQMGRSMLAAGVTDGDRLLNFVAPPPYATSSISPLMGLLDAPKVRTLPFRAPVIPKGTPEPERERIAKSYIDMMYDFGPRHVGGSPFIVRDFARFLTSYGFDKGRLSLKSVQFGGDPVTAGDLDEIKRLWGADPFDMYASTEVGIIAFECSSHQGLHLNERDLILTTIDPTSGDEVGPDAAGKDLFTNLYEEGEFPATFFLNYSHNDTVKILSSSCSCGVGYTLIGHPTRDLKKKPIPGFGFDIKEKKSIIARATRKVRRAI